MHFTACFPNRSAKLFRKRDYLTVSLFSIKQRAAINITAIHFLETHCLCTQLGGIAIVRLFVSTLILYRINLPAAGFSRKLNSLFRSVKFNNITLPRQTK